MRVHLPLRVRLTLAFAAATAVLLGCAGAYIFLQVKGGLDSSLDASLRGLADGYARLAQRPTDAGLRRALAVEGEPAQLLDSRGVVLASSPRGAGRPLLRGERLARALRGEVRYERREVVRILGRPAGPRRAIVVSTSMRQREQALESLGKVLIVGGPLILVLSSTAGFLVAAGALRPVDRMRRRAAEISRATPDSRLPVPPTRDEVHRLGVTLNAMLERLEATSRQERAFLANTSHELRTPLAILKTEVDLALHESATEAELRAALTSIGEEADRLARLSEDLLVIARGRDQALPLQTEDIALADVARGIVERFAVVHGDDVTSAVPPELRIRADRMRLDQALSNLVDNALRHGRPPVSVHARAHETMVALHVTDHGDGFTADQLDDAFERMGGGRAGGFGLGLAIVASIARAHGGDVGAANTPEGADVWLSLPRVNPTP